MSEPNFSFVSLPDCLMADIAQRIEGLSNELQHANPAPMVEPLRKLRHVRGNFALDLISSIAWAAETVCGAAATAGRSLDRVEVHSLQHSIQMMDRARRAAALSATM